MGMEAKLPGAASTATLEEPVRGEGYQQPDVDRPEERSQEAEPRRLGSLSGRIHRAGSILVVAGVAVAQLVWIALLAYGVYWLGAHR